MRRKLPKQIYTVSDLKTWEAATRGITPPIRLGVIGDPVDHSLSPEMQNPALRECGIEMQYARFHISDADLKEALELLRQNAFVGLNITLPHKERAGDMVDDVDELAREIGAINTIAIHDRICIGYNTDGIGFCRAVRDEFSLDLRDLRVLLLGAGGAGRAIAFECGRQNCERLVIANRTRERAEELVGAVQRFFIGPRVLGPVARLQAIGLDEVELRSQLAHTDLVVNATQLGLRRSDDLPIARHLLAPHLMILDTIYAPPRTPLALAAAEAGARAANGMSMLLHQGARAFEVWFAREAPIEVMRAALKATMPSTA